MGMPKPVAGAWTMVERKDGTVVINIVARNPAHAKVVRDALEEGLHVRLGVIDGSTCGTVPEWITEP